MKITKYINSYTISIFFLLILGVILYGTTLRGVYGNPKGSDIKNNLDQRSKPFELSPERNRFILTLSLAENHSFALTQELADAAYPDVGWYKGRFYVYFAPGISLFALPFYLLGKPYNLAQVGAFAVIPLFAIGNLIFLFLIARQMLKLPTWASLLAALIFGFASTSWSYALTLYQHQATTFFIVSSFYAVWRYRQKNSASFVWGMFIWMNYALAILIDYPNAVFMLPDMVYFFISALSIRKEESVDKTVSLRTQKSKTQDTKYKLSLRLSFVLSSILFILITIAHGYYNYANFGDWKKVSGSLIGYKTIKEQKLFDTGTAGQTKLKTLEAKKTPTGFFKEENIPHSFTTLMFTIDKGLFLFSPVFIVGVLGMLSMLSALTLETGVLIATVIFNVFLYSSFGDPWGGWAFGPRYLIPSMSLLSLFAAYWVSRPRFGLLRRLFIFPLIIYSTAIAIMGALTTNAVPPKIEADYLKMKYNFLLNYDVLKSNVSSSFTFNQFISHYMNAYTLFLILLGLLSLLFAVVLFVLPLFKRR